MIIDGSIEIENQNLIVNSQASNYSEVRLANIGLSRLKDDEDSELVEFFGENFTTEQMQTDSWYLQRDQEKRVYLVIYPFQIDKFEPSSAFRLVFLYSKKAYLMCNLKLKSLRELFRMDKFEVSLKIPNYDKVFAEKREEFERNLKSLSRNYKIES